MDFTDTAVFILILFGGTLMILFHWYVSPWIIQHFRDSTDSEYSKWFYSLSIKVSRWGAVVCAIVLIIITLTFLGIITLPMN